MVAPILTKAWTITPNLRRTFTSLNDSAAWCMYQNKVAMAGVGWTVVFSSNGTTGPSSGADTTDRWTSQAACTVRGATANAAQSWIVLQNATGMQVKLTYTGATDDVFTVAFSPGGVYTLQATTTWSPTATDEVVSSGTGSMVNPTTSLDRVMSIWCSNDTEQWSFVVFRAGAMVGYFGVERINNFCAPGVFTPDGSTERPYVGYRWGSGGLVRVATMGNEGGNHTITGCTAASSGLPSGGAAGTVARIFTSGVSRITRVAGGAILIAQQSGGSGYGTSTQTNTPAMQGGASSPVLPLYWSGDKAANIDGFIGYPIDWWQMVTSSTAIPAIGDFTPGFEPGDNPNIDPVRANWIVALGGACIRPWRNAAPTLEVT